MLGEEEDEELENDTIIKNNREATDLIVGEGNPNMILAIGKLYRIISMLYYYK